MRMFFFYGTLIAGSGNAAEIEAHDKLSPLGPGTVRGRLYGIRDRDGWYPALFPGAGRVRGIVYGALPEFAAADLARIDRYEDCDPARPDASLYVRRRLAIKMETGERLAGEAYVFNLALPNRARRIVSGDFREWSARNGLRPFGQPGRSRLATEKGGGL